MNLSSIIHRPESEMAYVYGEELIHLRLRTDKQIDNVKVMYGDPYDLNGDKWLADAENMKVIAIGQVNKTWGISIKVPNRRLKYAFVVQCDGEEIFYGDRGFYPVSEKYYRIPNFYFSLPYLHKIDQAYTPQWVKETVWYQIFPERFWNGDPNNDPKSVLPWGSEEPTPFNFFGGDLQGIIQKLDYLQKLGINGLYLCPIFKATSNHKYDTIDYFEIDPSFGTKADLKQLVLEAHKRNMKVMLDAVFNHSGDQMSQWQDVVENGENSSYKDWFHIHKLPITYNATDNYEVATDLSYDTFAYNPHMPKFDTSNEKVKQYLIDVATYWIKECDIDAWRLDVANEVDHVFWRDFKRACSQIKDDFYILGEIWHGAEPWLLGDQFNGTMNYAFCESIVQYFIKQEISAKDLVYILNDQLMRYMWQVNQANLNLLDSHDTARLLTVSNEDEMLLKQSFIFMFLQVGVPCIYYGTEVGMLGGADPLNRSCMIWDEKDQNHKIFKFFADLIEFRKKYSKVLSEGECILSVKDDGIKIVRDYQSIQIIGLFNCKENIKGKLLFESPNYSVYVVY